MYPYADRDGDVRTNGQSPPCRAWPWRVASFWASALVLDASQAALNSVTGTTRSCRRHEADAFGLVRWLPPTSRSVSFRTQQNAIEKLAYPEPIRFGRTLGASASFQTKATGKTTDFEVICFLSLPPERGRKAGESVAWWDGMICFLLCLCLAACDSSFFYLPPVPCTVHIPL